MAATLHDDRAFAAHPGLVRPVPLGELREGSRDEFFVDLGQLARDDRSPFSSGLVAQVGEQRAHPAGASNSTVVHSSAAMRASSRVRSGPFRGRKPRKR